ncbi:germinal-center associated nuclear protein-like isoform X1 [Biomphalaria glabrata]|uniref:Germinal-center associated nuclear protein n=1 Tax=Biomphalaria glabrata TaxID=6526 RepID=A0A9W3A7I4_BIOGL|nr:germinal-center associated nuclear protein-like isoform X1 [Biomphalaria glabrata]XP_055883268.1 germinal-center associated nuclear protein-like isoform X1 [Biomphalaria glabrata]
MQPSIFGANNTKSSGPESAFTAFGSPKLQSGPTFGGTQFGNQANSVFAGGTSVRSLFGGGSTENSFNQTQPPASTAHVSFGLQQNSVFGGKTTDSLFGRSSSEVAQTSSVFGGCQSVSSFVNNQYAPSQPMSGFGNTQQTLSFGSSQPQGSHFGATQSGTSFGSTQGSLSFGGAQSGSSFGSSQPSLSFGSTQSVLTFGGSQAFGNSASFGSTQAGSSFGTNQPSSSFGSAPPTSSLAFGNTSTVAPFGSTQSGTVFTSTPSWGSFGNQASTSFGNTQPGSSFGSTQTRTSFSSTQPNNQSGNPFGSSQPGTSFGSIQSGTSFGSNEANSQSGNIFGSTESSSQSSNIFGSTQNGSSFGTQSSTQFGSSLPSSQLGNLFGSTQSGSSLGSIQSENPFKNNQSASLLGRNTVVTPFGNIQPGSSFGSTQSSDLFGSTQSGTQFGSNQSESSVNKPFGSTQMGSSFDSPKFGSSQTGNPFGNSQTGSSFGSNQSGNAFGSTQVGASFGSTQGNTFGSTQTGSSFGSTQGNTFGSTQAGTSFGGTQGNTFVSTQAGTSFGNTQSGNTFGTTQSGPSFGSTQSGNPFGSTQAGPSFGSTQGNTFGGTQSVTTFGNTQGGSTIVSNQSGNQFNSTLSGDQIDGTQSGAIFGSTQPKISFGNTQNNKSVFGSTESGTSFGSTQSGSSLWNIQSSSLFGNQSSGSAKSQSGSLFGRDILESASDNTKGNSQSSTVISNSLGVTAEMQSSSFMGNKLDFSVGGSPASALGQTKSSFSGMQSEAISDVPHKVSTFGGIGTQPDSPHAQPSLENNQDFTGVRIKATSLFSKSGQPPSIFGSNTVPAGSQNTVSPNVFSSTIPKLDSQSQANLRKRPAHDSQGDDPLFGKLPASGFTTSTDESQMSTLVKPSEKTMSPGKKSDTERPLKNKTLFGKGESQPQGSASANNNNLFSTTQSPKKDTSERTTLFGNSLKPINLFGKESFAPQPSETKMSRVTSSFNLQVQSNDDNLSQESTSIKEQSRKALQKRGRLSNWSKDKISSDRRKRSSSVGEGEARETKRSCASGEPNSSSTVSRSRLASQRKYADDLTSKTTLVLKDIPTELNKGVFLRTHFSKFGKITKLLSMPNKRTANITFETHEQADLAKREGKRLKSKGPVVPIFWRSTSVKSPENKKGGETTKDLTTTKKSAFGSSVEDELASMAETCDFEEELTTERTKTRSRRHSPTPPPTVSLPGQMTSTVPDIETVKDLLKKIYHAKAKDTSGRIEILDARDKLLRILRGRQQSDLASAKAFSGTCPDMCPEKERYYREDIRRLALYEVIPSTLTSITGQKSKVDHSRAVKEYSRSSADQEEPLPHELRPLPVLVLTMYYLLSQVADQGGDGQWSEWYDFLWDRTRGIRKDITQQQLTDVLVAELLEKCARFHIICSERLCEEEPNTFDSKINNENLTKCLQTLKEIYADLEKKQIYCPNEAEFRGYMVLMNLNEGDTMREIQQLRPEVRDSEPIHFAVKAYNAVNSNNYVRFFRLIKGTSFLNACILHRYFNQIRVKALIIIMKAFNRINRMFPIQELTRLLCFENESETKEFCHNYCLSFEGNDIVLDSKTFAEPEMSLSLRRSQTLVETKLKTSIGEAINGCPLPVLNLRSPSSSFDPEGMFIITPDIQEALATSGLLAPRLAVQEVSEEQTNEPENSQQTVAEASFRTVAVKRENITVSNDVIKSLTRTLILEVIDKNIKDMATTVSIGHSILLNEVDNIVDDVVVSMGRSICKEVIEEEETFLRLALEEERKKLKEYEMSSVCDELVSSTVETLIQDIALDEMKLVNGELLRQCQARSSSEYSQELLNSVLTEMIASISQEVFEVDVVAKNERLKATARCVQLITCRKFFQCWKSKYISKIKVQRAMLDFPSAPPAISISEQLQKLVPARKDKKISEKSFYIGDRAKLTIASPMKIIQEQLYLTTHLTMASARKMLASLLMWNPLDLSSIVGPTLNTAVQFWLSEKLVDPDTLQPQWKLLVSLPEKQLEDVSVFHKWIRAKLCKNNARDTILETSPTYQGQVLTLHHINPFNSNSVVTPIGVCIRCFHGCWNDTQEIDVQRKDLLKGTNAVLFITSIAEELSKKSQLMAWTKDKKRLHQILLQKRKSPALPLVVIVPRLSEQCFVTMSMLDDMLELTSLYDQDLISAVHLAEPFIGSEEQHLVNYQDWTSQLTNSLKFTVNNLPLAPKLRAKPVSDAVEDAVVEFYKAPVFQDLRTRSKHQKLHQSPNTLLTLYNAVIEHVSMVTASGSLSDISWPSPEFDQHSISANFIPSTWNSEEHMCNLYELIGKLRLPLFRYSDMETEDWSTVCQDVWAYVNSLTKKDSGSAKLCLFHQVADLLSKVKKNFDQFCWLAEECGPCEPTYVNMAWTDLIDACIHYRLVSLRTGHVEIRKPEKAEDEEVEDYEEPMVYYIESELEDWQPPEVWLDAVRDTEQSEKGQIKGTVLKAKSFKEESLVESSENAISMSHTVAKPANQIPSAEWKTLKDQFEQERKRAAKLEETLQSLLSECRPEVYPKTPSFLQDVTPIVSLGHLSTCTLKADNFMSATPNRNKDSLKKTHSDSLPVKLSTLKANPNSSVLTERSSNSITVTNLSSRLDCQLSTPTLSNKMIKLQEQLQSQKEADAFFELNLRKLLNQ